MTPTNSDLSTSDIFHLILRRKVTFIVLTVLGASAGLLAGFIQEPVYRSAALLSVVEGTDTNSGLAGIASQLGGLASAINLGVAGSDRDVAIAVLRSRAFIVKFVRDRNIEKSLFAKRWLADANEWAADLGGAPSDSDIFEVFSRQVFNVREDNKTGLVTISIDWYDAELAANWANEVVREVNMQLRTRARLRAQNSLEFLESEAKRVSNTDTQKAIYGLIGRQINEIMLANVTHEYAFEVIDPATPSDSDDYVKPRKLFLLVSGLVAGFLLGVVLVVGIEMRTSMRTNSRNGHERRP